MVVDSIIGCREQNNTLLHSLNSVSGLSLIQWNSLMILEKSAVIELSNQLFLPASWTLICLLIVAQLKNVKEAHTSDADPDDFLPQIMGSGRGLNIVHTK